MIPFNEIKKNNRLCGRKENNKIVKLDYISKVENEKVYVKAGKYHIEIPRDKIESYEKKNLITSFSPELYESFKEDMKEREEFKAFFPQ
ncbi:MAG: hypothetical protein ACTSRG_19225 [Candidatus Helarchaeota archaeon]